MIGLCCLAVSVIIFMVCIYVGLLLQDSPDFGWAILYALSAAGSLAVLCVYLVAGLAVKGTEPRPVCECRCPPAQHVPPLVKERVPEIGARYL